VAALRDLSLQIGRGEVFGLLGPNGAGKSTLLKLLLGFLYPDKGTIRLFGSTNLTRAHARLGYLPEKPRYHGNFTGREYLQMHAGLSGFNSKDSRIVAEHSLRAVELGPAADRRIRTYSKGMMQRLGLAVVLSASGGRPPELLMLDEPGSGLDPEGQSAVRDFILDCKGQGSTVLMCSHQLTEVERICTSVAVLRAGRLVLQTRLDVPPRVYIGARPRDGAMEIAPYLISYLRSLHALVSVQGGEKDGEPLFVSLPTGKSIAGAERSRRRPYGLCWMRNGTLCRCT
jgi:ABC-2 type transport system ATP-binding protein